MENASKALIIAGAILLSILIIGLGMAVYNNASSTMGKTNMSSQEISAHNETFAAYEGRIKGSQVRSLLGAIANNNDEYEDRQIAVTYTNSATGKSDDAARDLTSETDSATIKATLNGVKTSTTYKVTFTYGGNDGLIDTCTIEVYGTTKTTE